MTDKTIELTLTKIDFEILLISAFRYSLGRSSCVPSVIADIIWNNKEQIRESTLKLFIDEIEERKRVGVNRLGVTLDVEYWLNLQERLMEYVASKECE